MYQKLHSIVVIIVIIALIIVNAEETTKFTCEGDSVFINCYNYKIQIIKAQYGLWHSEWCSKNNTLCLSDNAQEIVQQQCENQNNCRFEVSNRIFGDSCPRDIGKYLELKYTCV